MQCLHQLRNGRCFISCSSLSCSLGWRGSCLRTTFPLQNSPCSSCASHPSVSSFLSTSTPSIFATPASTLTLPWSHSVRELLPRFSSRWQPESRSPHIRVPLAEPHGFRRFRARLRVKHHHKHAIPPAYRNALTVRVLNERLMLPEHDHVSFVHNRAHRSQRSFDVRIRKTSCCISCLSNAFQSRVSFDLNGTSICRRQLHCPRRLAAPEPTVISTISCSPSTAFTSSSSSLSIDLYAKKLCPLAFCVSFAFS